MRVLLAPEMTIAPIGRPPGRSPSERQAVQSIETATGGIQRSSIGRRFGIRTCCRVVSVSSFFFSASFNNERRSPTLFAYIYARISRKVRTNLKIARCPSTFKRLFGSTCRVRVHHSYLATLVIYHHTHGSKQLTAHFRRRQLSQALPPGGSSDLVLYPRVIDILSSGCEMICTTWSPSSHFILCSVFPSGLMRKVTGFLQTALRLHWFSKGDHIWSTNIALGRENSMRRTLFAM